MKLEFETTDSGFICGSYVDSRGWSCGIENGRRGYLPPYILLTDNENNVTCLSQEQVAALLPLLQRFAETGRLGREEG